MAITKTLIMAVVAGLLVACTPGSSSTSSATTLGTADSFAVVAGSTVTNTGPTTIVGDLGLSPGSAITGFPPGMVSGGVIHAADAVALQAQADVTTAYNALAGLACDRDLTDQDLGGLTLTPGVSCFSSSAQLTGTLTLDAEGNPDALFVFQIGSTLTTASQASVLVINGAGSCNVFWQVGSSATLGTGTTFVGSILALTSITLTTGAEVFGRALARNGSVTMDTNHLEVGTCGDTGETDAGALDAYGAADANQPGGADANLADAYLADAKTCVNCASLCVELSSHHEHCGGCGIACAEDESCNDGVCTPPQ